MPFPADYGGAIEEFYKIKSLYLCGVKVYLHCFIYGDRERQDELEMYCEKVYYYERKRSIKDACVPISIISLVTQILKHQTQINL